MTAKEYLQQAYRIAQLIQLDQQTIAEMEALATSISIGSITEDKVCFQGERDKIGRILELIESQKKLTRNRICYYAELKINILEKIHSIPNVDHRLILQYRYLDFRTWEEIAIEMGYSYRHITRIHREALAGIHNQSREL